MHSGQVVRCSACGGGGGELAQMARMCSRLRPPLQRKPHSARSSGGSAVSAFMACLVGGGKKRHLPLVVTVEVMALTMLCRVPNTQLALELAPCRGRGPAFRRAGRKILPSGFSAK